MECEVTEHDARLITPFTCIYAGPTMSGKTSHLFNILRNGHDMIDKMPKNILYFYNQHQPIFSRFDRENIVTEWINALPTVSLLQEKTAEFADGEGSIVIIDDFMQELNADVLTLFSVLCHANRISVFLLSQNIFPKNPKFRDISVNATYIVVFKNPRDSAQIMSFARQFAPGRVNSVIDAFRASTQFGYSYMLFDLHQKSDEAIRMRSHIFPHEWPIRVYVPRGVTPRGTKRKSTGELEEEPIAKKRQDGMMAREAMKRKRNTSFEEEPALKKRQDGILPSEANELEEDTEWDDE